MIIHILDLIKAELPDIAFLMQRLSKEVYDPIMAGEVPTLSLLQLTAQYPCFGRCVATHLAQAPAVRGVLARHHSAVKPSISSSVWSQSLCTSDRQEDPVSDSSHISQSEL